MDYITIDNLRIGAIHGHYEHEWQREQRFDVSLRVAFASGSSGASDTLSDTIDYDDLRAIIEEVFSGERRYLVERIAHLIIDRIMEDSRALEVTISIKKPEAWDNGIPGVSITRKRVGD